jgi:hypothetical protein
LLACFCFSRKAGALATQSPLSPLVLSGEISDNTGYRSPRGKRAPLVIASVHCRFVVGSGTTLAVE